MILNEKLRVNAPHVVHDTIDGETILVNLRNGNYYSLDACGGLIWEVLLRQGNLDVLAQALAAPGGAGREETSDAIAELIAALLKEQLVVADEETATVADPISPEEISRLAQDLLVPFRKPEIRVYADMQDMLLLDPIHDTDEQGWPQARLD